MNTNGVQQERVKCTRCKVSLPETHFDKKRSGDFYKHCRHCLEKNAEYKVNYLCQHNTLKKACKECKEAGEVVGGSICEHDRLRSKCRDCKEDDDGGGSFCEHDKRESR